MKLEDFFDELLELADDFSLWAEKIRDLIKVYKIDKEREMTIGDDKNVL